MTTSSTPPGLRQDDTPRLEALDDLIRQHGGDPENLSGQLVREMIHTSLKLIRDGADVGEMKLVSRSLKELRYAMKIFRPYRSTRKISIFGSARTKEEHPNYQAALQFAKGMSAQGWMVITGAGDGIMAAGHGGAGPQASFGVAIRLPFETNANKFIKGDPKLVTFRYFFTRKLMFVSQAHAMAVFPGGFGTHDEGFEVLTLIQTGKSPIIPVVLCEEPGGAYWYYWNEYIRHHLLDTGMIGPEDLNLYYITDDPAKATQHVLDFYSNYHSQRFVRDDLVMRIHKPLAPRQLELLNGEFADLVAEGKITQTQALPEERETLELPRLKFVFVKRGYGRLRRMIDRINAFAKE
ncbi:MAG: LOG family protein [Phycisphaeraceae bacterium]